MKLYLEFADCPSDAEEYLLEGSQVIDQLRNQCWNVFLFAEYRVEEGLERFDVAELLFNSLFQLLQSRIYLLRSHAQTVSH